MKYTRRSAMSSVFGVLATAAATHTPRVAAQQPACKGNVRKDGKPLFPGKVERAGAGGKVDTADTNQNGNYEFPTAAPPGIYQLRFRDSTGSVFHTIDRLTADAGIDQNVSVTAPPAKPTFQSLYYQLQAQESLIAFAHAFPQARPGLQQGDLARVRDIVGGLRQSIGNAGLPPRQAELLNEKASAVDRASVVPFV